MDSTLDLLDAAMTEFDISARALSLQLGHSPWTLNRARERGTLSPVIAGQIAELMQLSVEHWMARAVLESEPSSRATDRLRRTLEHVRNS